MPRYYPLTTGEGIEVSRCEMCALNWDRSSLSADFSLLDGHRFRVEFENVLTFRVLDEMPISTETEPTPEAGIIPNHFAYRVEEASFWLNQSEAFKIVFGGKARHYRFFTNTDCLDVISTDAPVFARIEP